jgi:hypothetical protein
VRYESRTLRVSSVTAESLQHQVLPAFEQKAAVVELDRQQIRFAELLASREGIPDLAGAGAVRICAEP